MRTEIEPGTKGMTVKIKLDKEDVEALTSMVHREVMEALEEAEEGSAVAEVCRLRKQLEGYRYAWETALRWIRCGVSEEDDGTWTDINSLSPHEAMRRGMRRCLYFMEGLDRQHIKGNGNDDKGELE